MAAFQNLHQTLILLLLHNRELGAEMYFWTLYNAECVTEMFS